MARITQQSSIHTTGVSYENEPIVRSDGSGEIMQWQPSDGGADGIYITEGGSAGDPARLGIGVTPGAALHVSKGATNNIADDLSSVRFIGADKPITGEQANLVIQTNDDFAINKGGSIGLGGRHTTSSTNGANFAQISGRKENATTANFAGYLAFSTSDAASDIHERVRITSDGSVGIGTPTPTVGNLQIRDDSVSILALTRTTASTSSDIGMVRFGNTNVDSNLANIVAYHDGANDSAKLVFQTQATGGATADRLTIDSSGRVGVGNSAPSAPLEVSQSQSSTVTAISTFSTADAEHSVLALKKSSSATVGTKAVTADGEILGRIDAYGVDTNSNQRRGAQIEFSQAAASTGSKVAGNIIFKTSSTSANDVTALTISSSGNVGIGAVAPTELLELASSSDPTLLIRHNTADQANSGKISYREASGGTTGVDLRYDGNANNFIIDTSDVANALVIARTTGAVTMAGPITVGSLDIGHGLGGDASCTAV